MSDPFAAIRTELIADPANAGMRELGYEPLYTAGPTARIAVVGQAPGRLAQASGVPWDDASGVRLRDWLGVTEQQFRDPRLFALVPMDFYYPGRGTGGDLPPRRGFAERWHPPLFALMPELRLTLLIGSYAQAHYLGRRRKASLTETVHARDNYLPEFFRSCTPHRSTSAGRRRTRGSRRMSCPSCASGSPNCSASARGCSRAPRAREELAPWRPPRRARPQPPGARSRPCRARSS